jgi:hypothetical protein
MMRIGQTKYLFLDVNLIFEEKACQNDEAPLNSISLHKDYFN